MFASDRKSEHISIVVKARDMNEVESTLGPHLSRRIYLAAVNLIIDGPSTSHANFDTEQ